MCHDLILCWFSEHTLPDVQMEEFLVAKKIKQAKLFSFYSDLKNSYVHFVLRRRLNTFFWNRKMKKEYRSGFRLLINENSKVVNAYVLSSKMISILHINFHWKSAGLQPASLCGACDCIPWCCHSLLLISTPSNQLIKLLMQHLPSQLSAKWTRLLKT